jgi:hypothetical protein
VWRDVDYAYAATTSGLSIFDLSTTNKVASIFNESGFTTIWGNDSTIYLGTSDAGLKYLDKSVISPGGLEEYLLDYDYYYNASSSNIKYLHGSGDMLAVVTDISIDVIRNGANSFKSTTSGTNFLKCFLTSKKELYYTEQSEDSAGVGKINCALCDWDAPDVYYGAGTSFLPEGHVANDIFVTESTAGDGIANTLFVASSYGAYVIDESTSEFEAYYVKEE